MKIIDVKAVYPNHYHATNSWRTHFWQIVVRIETECGIVGWGYGGGGVAAGSTASSRCFKTFVLKCS